MNRRAFLALGVMGSAALMVPCCRRAPLTGPPQLRLGRDECIECGMIINEDRCSSAFLIEREGLREYVMFDDIGCMLDYQHEQGADIRIVEGFVHDHGSRAWVSRDAAAFLFADRIKIPTPMGSGIVAFAGHAEAERAQAELGGQIMDYKSLIPARRAWMEKLYGKPRSAP